MREYDKEDLNLVDAEEFANLLFPSRDKGNASKGYYGLGTVINVSGKQVGVSLDSSPGKSTRKRRFLSSYSPSVGDRVLILHDIVIGSIK